MALRTAAEADKFELGIGLFTSFLTGESHRGRFRDIHFSDHTTVVADVRGSASRWLRVGARRDGKSV